MKRKLISTMAVFFALALTACQPASGNEEVETSVNEVPSSEKALLNPITNINTVNGLKSKLQHVQKKVAKNVFVNVAKNKPKTSTH